MGANQWRDEDDWPLASALETKYFLHSGGKANSAAGDGALTATPPRSEQADQYNYDPANAVPKPDFDLEKELAAVSSLIREVGEALESVGETLADGVVEEKELKVTIPKLEAVIRETASLKYMLEELSKRRKKTRTY